MLKLFLLGCICILSINVFGQCSTNYELVWSDEFDGTAVNTSNWSLVQGGGGFGNQEVQYYQPQNATVSGGLLHITVKNETVVDGSTTYDYTSAKLETASLQTFTYGRMEASIKMPDAMGTWPAFWMLGANIGTVGWPHCGEIDVMEWVARGPDAATGSIFFDGVWPDNHISTPYNIPSGQSFTTDFHTFAVEWEPNEIRYYCDDNLYATYKNTSIAPKEWVFNHDFFLILNCAIGGTGGGSNINIVNPTNMDIDYVRVYSLPTTAGSINLNGPTRLMENSQNVLYTTNYFPSTTYTWTVPSGASIVDGQGTNTIHVNYTTGDGVVEVSATNTCNTLSNSVAVTLIADECTIVYDNFEDIRDVTYSATGTLTENYANPSQDAVNSSSLVGQYQRSLTENYDVLGLSDIALENALHYENGSKVFFMDILTDAPIGTPITLQLENSDLSVGSYPQGRRSSYTTTVSKQNEWHTVKFTFNQIISSGTPPDQVDHISILFDPGTLTDNTYYIDNFKRVNSDATCGYLTTAVTQAESSNELKLYPNPVNNTLYIKNKDESQAVVIYNRLGEKVIENIGNQIDVSNLTSGIYVLKTGLQTLKFVKQ